MRCWCARPPQRATCRVCIELACCGCAAGVCCKQACRCCAHGEAARGVAHAPQPCQRVPPHQLRAVQFCSAYGVGAYRGMRIAAAAESKAPAPGAYAITCPCCTPRGAAGDCNVTGAQTNSRYALLMALPRGVALWEVTGAPLRACARAHCAPRHTTPLPRAARTQSHSNHDAHHCARALGRRATCVARRPRAQGRVKAAR